MRRSWASPGATPAVLLGRRFFRCRGASDGRSLFPPLDELVRTAANQPSSRRAPQGPPWGNDVRQLDRLLTWGCNNFLQSLLSSVVFEPERPCNICGAWVQGAFAVLDSSQAKADLQIPVSTLITRNPKIGFLWLGAAILGIHAFILRGMRAVFYQIDLTIAGWTDTVISLIQQPVEISSPAQAAVSRADEARLMFLSQSFGHDDPPTVPFPPFGTTAIEDCTLEVREHATCAVNHRLCYSKWTWDCRDEPCVLDFPSPAKRLDDGASVRDAVEAESVNDSAITVDYNCMDRESDCSEKETHNLFNWLRNDDGFPIAQREIRKHEWMTTCTTRTVRLPLRSTSGRGLREQ